MNDTVQEFLEKLKQHTPTVPLDIEEEIKEQQDANDNQ